MTLELKLPGELAAARPIIQSRLQALVDAVTCENFSDLCDGTVRALLRDGFRRSRADEGSVWLLSPDRSSLVMAYNTGPNAQRMVGTVRQSLRQGIVSMAAATEQAFLETDVHSNQRFSRDVDERFGQTTRSMIVAPIYFLRECRGVMSCVQLREEPGRSPFGHADLVVIQHLAAAFDDLIDYRLLARATGWYSE